jgi:ribonucleotide reductase beta subunit family protein with ferritin-like domain
VTKTTPKPKFPGHLISYPMAVATESLQYSLDDAVYALHAPMNSPASSAASRASSAGSERKEIPSLLLACTAADTEAAQPEEPILQDNPDRFSLFPIKKPVLYAKYKQHVAAFWTPEEVDLSKDVSHWRALDPRKQHFIKYVLGFFHGSDGIVMENLSLRFSNEVQIPEARCFYAFQNAMESVHSETYALLIDTYIEDKDEKLEIQRAIQTIPCVQKKAEWAQRWITSPIASFATRLIGFAAVEGIFFSGSFCAIFWLKQQGIMPGLTTSNEFISRDEALHTDFACELYKELIHKVPQARVYEIIEEAVEIEKYFITKALPCDLIGMNAVLMSQYIEFVADRLLVQLGYARRFGTANPFDFMERIALEGKDNFFEKRVTSYAKAGVGKTREEMSFSLDADF